jgi:hypothetical protein
MSAAPLQSKILSHKTFIYKPHLHLKASGFKPYVLKNLFEPAKNFAGSEIIVTFVQ